MKSSHWRLFQLPLTLPHFSHLQLLEIPECDREDWCKQQGAESALNKIITTGFRAIHLIYFFTAGADEVKCWQIRKATKAPQVGPGRFEV